MNWMRRNAMIAGVIAAMLCGLAAATVHAQEPQKPMNLSEPPPPPEEAVVDPYLAHKSFEIGMHYFKWRNYDAAIARFHETIKHKPDHARAHMMLGEAHEKKDELKDAIAFYKKFLEILPNAPEAEKLKKRIEKLQKKLPKPKESALKWLRPEDSAG